MDSADTDPRLGSSPERLARPLIEAFIDSVWCPPDERWHASSTLTVLALFVSATTAARSLDGLAWGELDADRLVDAALDVEAGDHSGFLCELLDLSAAFYGFLRERGDVSVADARRVRARLITLALGLRHL